MSAQPAGRVQLRATAGELIPELAGHQRRAFTAGAAAGGVALIGLVLDPAQFLRSYLAAYMLVLGATLGCLALGMIHQLSGGAWGVVTRRLFGAASRVLPVLTLLFLPIAIGMPQLYEWTHADAVGSDEVLLGKQLYLNTPFFLVRALLYFAVWNALAFFLNRWSLQQDHDPDPAIARRMQRTSGGGLVAYVLTASFASYDWLMSLDPHWFSTIYGVLIIGGHGVTALCVLVIALVWLSRRPPLDTIVTPGHFHDLGNLLLAFVMLWAYFSFSQYLIIYSANLPEEITWYTRRLHTGWRFVGIALILFHFAVPFLILLSRVAKREPATIFRVAAGLLVVRLVDLIWLIAPEFHPDGLVISWLDVVLPLSLGGLWVGCFIWQLRGRAILPVHDPQFGEALGGLVESGGRPGTVH
jgi:hypothetical protein